MTDKPVVTMSPQSVSGVNVGDTVILGSYAIGVPPLAYQWQYRGAAIPGATATNYTITNFTVQDAGYYSLAVTNLYGSALSAYAIVTANHTITQAPTPTTNVVSDTNPDNAQHNGLNQGATWLASSGSRTGVMAFGESTNSIIVADSADLDSTNGETITFWMQSSGVDTNTGGITGAAIVERPVSGSSGAEFALVQLDNGDLQLFTPSFAVGLTSTKSVSDNNWHFIALTYTGTTSGGATLYIDGTLNVTNANSSGWSPAGSPLSIGSGSDNYYNPYVGNLDSFRCYSAILSPSEITSIFTSDALADPADLDLDFEFAAAPGAGVNLSWPDAGVTLESAPTLLGPWTPVSGVSSPYTIIPTVSAQFFRYVYPNPGANTPQTWIANPYLM